MPIEESLRLETWGVRDVVLDTSSVSGGSVVFVGVTSHEPIPRIELHFEVDLGDDAPLGGFRISTQPPVRKASLDDDNAGVSALLVLLANWGEGQTHSTSSCCWLLGRPIRVDLQISTVTVMST